MLSTTDSTPTARVVQKAQELREMAHARKQIPCLQPSLQLPLWSESVRCMPNEILRTALFNARNRKQPRTQLDDVEIAVIGNARITYGGEELRQDDETVWLQLIHMARGSSLGHPIKFTPYSFCKAIRWSNDSRSYQRLRECLKRMQKTSLEISSVRDERKFEVNLCMIPEFDCTDTDTGKASRLYQVALSPKLIRLFEEEDYNTRLEWSHRLALPTGIATWLHGYYSSHKTPVPIKLETIKKGAGITMQSKHLRRHVTQALEALKDIGFLEDYRFDGDLVHITRRGKFSMLNHAKKFSGGQRR